MILFKMQSTLEPGLVRLLRLYAIIGSALLPVLWRITASMLGVTTVLNQYFPIGVPLLLFLVIYTTVPWWERRMGRAFLPTALVLLAGQAILGNYLALQWFVPSNLRESATLTLMPRVWFNLQFLVLIVAWQYNLFWVAVVGIGLSLLDAALIFRFVNAGGALYPLFVTLVVGRLLSVTAVGVAFAWLVERQRRQSAALAQANQKLIQYAATTEQLAISHERNRLARELHDTLAHSLSSVTVQLVAVQAVWDVNSKGARQMLDQALQSTRHGLTEARRALQSLRASPLEDLGLGLAVSDLAESAAARADLTLALDVQNPLENLSPEVEQCIYRVAQEALTNVVRHADATSIRVALGRKNGALILTVADDGCGFASATLNAANGAHYGLKGLRERAEMVGGVLEVDSQPQMRTTVRLTIH